MSLSAEVPRCVVCGWPMPRTEQSAGVCSRRCAGRAAEARALRAEQTAIESRILAEVRKLQRGTTICPGELAHRVLPGKENPLQLLRPILQEMADRKMLRWLQRGRVVLWWKVRGPFRIGASR